MSEKNKYRLVNEEELEQIRKKVASELELFLDGIVTKRADYELFRQAYIDFIPRLGRAYEIVDFLIKDFNETTKFQAKEETQWLFVYLGLIESYGSSIIDMIVMLLVANGRDFHIECRYTTPRIKHVGSINDLEEERVSLTTKLHFLEDNGVKKLASIVDSALRNDIAHLRFTVKENRIYLRGKPAWYVLGNSYRKLLAALGTARKLITKLATAKGISAKQEETNHA